MNRYPFSKIVMLNILFNKCGHLGVIFNRYHRSRWIEPSEHQGNDSATGAQINDRAIG